MIVRYNCTDSPHHVAKAMFKDQKMWTVKIWRVHEITRLLKHYPWLTANLLLVAPTTILYLRRKILLPFTPAANDLMLLMLIIIQAPKNLIISHYYNREKWKINYLYYKVIPMYVYEEELGVTVRVSCFATRALVKM